MIRLGIGGISGRMGRAICESARNVEGVVVAGGTVRDPAQTTATDLIVTVDPSDLTGRIDVFVDVSTSDAVPPHLAAMRGAAVPYVCGVTGLSGDHQQAFDVAAETIPVLVAANFSVGVAAVTRLLELAAALLPDADVEIVETHHRGKKDAPSGTGLVFVEAVERARSSPEQRVFGRQGVSPRRPGEIGIQALRGGGNPGEHRVLFAMDGEEVVIEHRALSRSTFADGAVRAAQWVTGLPPGRYTMQDAVAARPID